MYNENLLPPSCYREDVAPSYEYKVIHKRDGFLESFACEEDAEKYIQQDIEIAIDEGDNFTRQDYRIEKELL